jgi:hypothetical protein
LERAYFTLKFKQYIKKLVKNKYWRWPICCWKILKNAMKNKAMLKDTKEVWGRRKNVVECEKLHYVQMPPSKVHVQSLRSVFHHGTSV